MPDNTPSICRFHEPGAGARIGLVRAGEVFDLTSANPGRFGSIASLLAYSRGRATLGEDLSAAAPARSLCRFEELAAEPTPGARHLLAPLDTQEVWGCGVTYLRSRDARMEESTQPTIYDHVYTAERPEVFFKATPQRVVGPGEPVRVRRDSRWHVPEPEFALVINQSLELVGYTIGNDMSARDIEGENPLYLPQAKIYMGCCALGPVIRLADPAAPLERFEMEMAVERAGQVIFQGRTSTAQMARSFADLIRYLGIDNAFPEGVVLLTGTGIIPPDDFSLEAGDRVHMEVAGIGRLTNPVRRGWPG